MCWVLRVVAKISSLNKELEIFDNMGRKAALKRIKITKTGKLLRRKAGQNHFNAKEPRRKQLRQKSMQGFSSTMEKKIRAYI